MRTNWLLITRRTLGAVLGRTQGALCLTAFHRAASAPQTSPLNTGEHLMRSHPEGDVLTSICWTLFADKAPVLMAPHVCLHKLWMRKITCSEPWQSVWTAGTLASSSSWMLTSCMWKLLGAASQSLRTSSQGPSAHSRGPAPLHGRVLCCMC